MAAKADSAELKMAIDHVDEGLRDLLQQIDQMVIMRDFPTRIQICHDFLETPRWMSFVLRWNFCKASLIENTPWTLFLPNNISAVEIMNGRILQYVANASHKIIEILKSYCVLRFHYLTTLMPITVIHTNSVVYMEAEKRRFYSFPYRLTRFHLKSKTYTAAFQ